MFLLSVLLFFQCLCCVWGEGVDFSLDNFVIRTSWDKVNKSIKADLLIVSSFYDIQVLFSPQKVDQRQALCEKLVEKGVLSAFPLTHG